MVLLLKIHFLRYNIETMTFLEFSIGTDDIDRRIDRVLRKFLRTMPLSILYKNIRSGFIRVNNAKIKIDYKTKKDDIICIEKNLYEKLKDTLKDNQKNNNVEDYSSQFIETIFENEHIKIINKPYGINVQSSTKDDVSLDTIIKSEFLHKQKSNTDKKSLSFVPGPLHRLDKNTTGLLAFSQSLVGARYFSEAIVNHAVEKTYLCILCGTLKDECTWQHEITRSAKSEYKGFHTVTVNEQCEHASNAKTFVSPIGHGTYYDEDITIAKVIIETGRTHQIRSQASYSKFPLLGDSAYGYRGKAEQFYLHAWTLVFPLNNTIGLPEKLTANLPENFNDFILKYLPNMTVSSYN